MSRVEHLTECVFAVSELIVAEVLAVQIKQIEGEENGISAAEKKVIESGTAFGIQRRRFHRRKPQSLRPRALGWMKPILRMRREDGRFVKPGDTRLYPGRPVLENRRT
jgi:hypothetical protein